eukprot:859628-Rhodomonas_salina.1
MSSEFDRHHCATSSDPPPTWSRTCLLDAPPKSTHSSSRARLLEASQLAGAGAEGVSLRGAGLGLGRK